MNNDYTACENKKTCIHRRGCRRWLGNYEDDYANYMRNQKIQILDDKECMNSHFEMLDRFRNSDGGKMK